MLPAFPQVSISQKDSTFTISILGAHAKQLHSARNPTQEAQRQAQQLNNTIGTNDPAPVLIGCGCGYILDALKIENYELYKKIIIYEPILEIKKNKKLQTHLSQKIYSKNHYLSNLEDLKQAILKTNKSATIFIHPIYKRYFQNQINSIIALLHKKQLQSTKGAREKFIRTWVRNTFHHILQSQNLHFLKPMEKTPFESVVYCGAGPSLFDDLESMGIRPGYYYPHLFIVASDTSLPALLDKNYNIDLCLSIDAGPGTWFHFSTLLKQSLPIDVPVLGWLGGSSYYNHYFKNHFFYKSTLPLDQLLSQEPLKHILEWVNTSNNIAGLSLLLAHNMSIKKVIMTGSSFSIQQGKTHISGTGYQEYARLKTNRLNNMVLYQPGGYSNSSQKNILAKEGIEIMAKEMSIDVVFAPSITHSSVVTNHTHRPQLEIETIHTSKIKSFLISHWHLIDKKAWIDSGMPINYHQKGSILLGDHV